MPARRTEVVRAEGLVFVENHPSEPGNSIRVAEYLGPGSGAVHLHIHVVELLPGAWVEGHLHPFEESFYVLEGRAFLDLNHSTFELEPGDFGVLPIAHGHAWANRGSESVKLLRVRSPQPRPIRGRGGWGVYAAPAIDVPESGTRLADLGSRQWRLRHFPDDVPSPPASLMAGQQGGTLRDESLRMAVDEAWGARHHRLSVVEFAQAGPSVLAREHYHPFEEACYLLSGAASGSFDGQRVRIGAGDLVFAGVGASHGLTVTSEAPLRWIEAQAPLSHGGDSAFFHEDWDRLTPIA